MLSSTFISFFVTVTPGLALTISSWEKIAQRLPSASVTEPSVIDSVLKPGKPAFKNGTHHFFRRSPQPSRLIKMHHYELGMRIAVERRQDHILPRAKWVVPLQWKGMACIGSKEDWLRIDPRWQHGQPTRLVFRNYAAGRVWPRCWYKMGLVVKPIKIRPCSINQWQICFYSTCSVCPFHIPPLITVLRSRLSLLSASS